MKIEEYLNKVTEQIRCKKAHESVEGELKNHILDQMEAYKQKGMDEEEALDKAIIEMGDPVEVGASFDRIHRPQISWSMIILVGLISMLSIVLQLTLKNGDSGYMEYSSRRQIFFVILGYIGMLLIYYLDYSFIGRYATGIGIAFLMFMIATKPFRIGINGNMSYLHIGGISFSIPLVMSLFVPLFGAIIFQYRGQGYGAIGKSMIWMMVATGITIGVSLPYACFWGLAMFALLSIAVWKDWFKVNKKKVLGVSGSIAAVGSIIGFGAATAMIFTGSMKTYQADRIRAFLTQSGEANYVADTAMQILENSDLIGGNAENLKLATLGLPGAQSELIFVSIVACYGILAGILVAGLMIFLVQKIFQISFGQKNQLGMILGCGCGMVFGVMAFFSIIQSLGLFPITAVILPFFSNSGSGTIVFYILLGMVLSIYRYQNIPMSHRYRKAKKLKIYFE